MSISTALKGNLRKPKTHKNKRPKAAVGKEKLVNRPLNAKTMEECFSNPIIQVGIKEPGVIRCRLGQFYPRENDPCFCMRERFK